MNGPILDVLALLAIMAHMVLSNVYNLAKRIQVVGHIYDQEAYSMSSTLKSIRY